MTFGASSIRADGPSSAAPVLIDETVVTGTKVETERWQATTPVQVVPKARVEETTVINLENALGEVPGLYIRRNEQFGLGASTIRMQGADPNKVAILIDGRRARGGVDGVVDLRDLPANNVERIEVLRGPASSLYGSDAMAGVVNIITRQGGEEPTFEGSVATGDFGRKYGAVSHGWHVGPVRYYLSALHDEFKLFEQFGNVSEQFAGKNRDATQDRDNLTLRVDADVAPGHALSFFPSFHQQTDPDSRSRHLILGGEWRWDVADAVRVTSWVNRHHFDRTNSLKGFEEDVNYDDTEGESRTEIDWAGGPWARHTVSVGGRVRSQELDQKSPGTSTGLQPHVQASVWQVSPFVQSDVKLTERVSLLTGVSFDVHEQYGFDANPRATLTWWPSEWLRLSATGGRGFRAPDLGQLFNIDVNFGGLYTLLGNPNLSPETDVAFQFEANVKFPGVDGFVSAFRHDFDDLIGFTRVVPCRPGRPQRNCVVDPVPGLPGSLRFQTRNFASAITQGVELGVEVSLPRVLQLDIPYDVRLGLGYEFLDSENHNGIPGEDGKDLPFRPHHRVLPSLTWRHPALGTTLKIWGEYETDAFTDSANSPEFLAREHWLWNFKVTLSPFRWLPDPAPGTYATALGLSRHVEFFVQGENVFDQEYGTVTAGGKLAGPATFLSGVSFRF